MTILTYLYYLTGIAFLIFEYYSLKSFDEYYKFFINKNKNSNDKTLLFMQGCFFSLYWLWGFIGLLTSQWILFLIFLIINTMPYKRSKFLMFFNKTFNILMILFIIINKYHLRIDFFNYF
jgi:hypothetical protein